MNDLYWWMGFILFWAIVAAYILLWMLVSYGAWIRVWDENKCLVIPFSRLVTQIRDPLIHVTEIGRKQFPEVNKVPKYMWWLIESDDAEYNAYPGAWGITRRRRHRAMVEAIRQAYFTKQN